MLEFLVPCQIFSGIGWTTHEHLQVETRPHALRVTAPLWRPQLLPEGCTARQFIEAVSLGIHVGHREADGTVWLADGGDLWASSPILFREMPAPAASTTAGATP